MLLSFLPICSQSFQVCCTPNDKDSYPPGNTTVEERGLGPGMAWLATVWRVGSPLPGWEDSQGPVGLVSTPPCSSAISYTPLAMVLPQGPETPGQRCDTVSPGGALTFAGHHAGCLLTRVCNV